MKASSVVRAVLEFDVAEYVSTTRTVGRHYLDPELRNRMAELYVDLRDVLYASDAAFGRQELRVLRFAELVLQSEWKLADPSGTGCGAGTLNLFSGPRGKRYQPYSNVRLLNQVLGTRRRASDASIEHRCRQVLRFLVRSWLAYERRSVQGTETWGWQRCPTPGEMEERVERVAALSRETSDWPSLPRPQVSPPACWDDYVGAAGRSDTLEYLVNLPQTQQHDENAFLRVIHLTEVTTSGILARILGARTWLEKGRLPEAGLCLERAARLARVQLDVMRVLRRTMSVENFLGFRKETGDASAVQMTSSQALHIHLLGVHPLKVEALGAVPENSFLLLHLNERFQPLRSLLQEVPRGTEEGVAVLRAARDLDEALYAWRRLHLGLAHRYLPKDSTGSGGTSGAPYLSGFYQDRLFNPGGELFPHPVPVSSPSLDEQRARARSVFSPMN
jgi:tryptophan 2,3-dioxygenase